MLKFHEQDWGADYALMRETIMASVNSDFLQWDTNNDKKVSRDEMTNFWMHH